MFSQQASDASSAGSPEAGTLALLSALSVSRTPPIVDYFDSTDESRSFCEVIKEGIV